MTNGAKPCRGQESEGPQCLPALATEGSRGLCRLQPGFSSRRHQPSPVAEGKQGVAVSLKQLSSERKERRADKGVAREGRSSERVLFCSFFVVKDKRMT